MVKDLFDDEKSFLVQKRNDISDTCEIVRPRHYDVLSWVGTPLPDYSFVIEPEVKERKIDEVLKRLKEGLMTFKRVTISSNSCSPCRNFMTTASAT